MKNETIKISQNYVPDEIVSPIWTGIIYAIFWGLTLLFSCIASIVLHSWILKDDCQIILLGKSTLGFHSLTYLRIEIILNMVFGTVLLYVVFKIFRNRNLSAFSGMYRLLTVFLIILYARIIVSSFETHSNPYLAYSWIIVLPSLYIPILFFSIPLTSKTSHFAFWGVLIALTSLCLFTFIASFPLILNGFTVKSGRLEFMFHNFVRLMLTHTALMGTYLSLICAWKMFVEKKVSILLIAAILYFCGTATLYFSTSRSALLGYIFAHLFLLAIPSALKNRKRLLFVIFVIVTSNLFASQYLVGNYPKSESMLGRSGIKFVLDKIQLLKQEVHKSSLNKGSDPNTTAEIPSLKQNVSESPLSKKNDPNTTAEILSLKQNVFESPLNKENNPNTTAEIQSLKQDVYKSMDYFTSGRVNNYRLAIEQIKQYPLLGSNLRLHESITSTTTCHNEILSVTMGTGIIGGTLFIIILLIGFYDAMIAIRKTPEVGWLGIIFISLLVIIQFRGGIERDYFLWFSLVALHANAYRYKKSNQVVSDISTGEQHFEK
jgi:hypothetical protein